MAVVPSHELGSRVRAGAILALDAQPVVGHRPDRVDDRVVAVEQLLARDVGAQLDASEEAETFLRGGLLVAARDRLDLRVIRRNAGAHQPERRRQRVVEVDREARLQQVLAGVEAGRAGSYDCYALLHYLAAEYRSATLSQLTTFHHAFR